jgi:hypothetical protein
MVSALFTSQIPSLARQEPRPVLHDLPTRLNESAALVGGLDAILVGVREHSLGEAIGNAVVRSPFPDAVRMP